MSETLMSNEQKVLVEKNDVSQNDHERKLTYVIKPIFKKLEDAMPETLINNEQKVLVEENDASPNDHESEEEMLSNENISGGYQFSKVGKVR